MAWMMVFLFPFVACKYVAVRPAYVVMEMVSSGRSDSTSFFIAWPMVIIAVAHGTRDIHKKLIQGGLVFWVNFFACTTRKYV